MLPHSPPRRCDFLRARPDGITIGMLPHSPPCRVARNNGAIMGPTVYWRKYGDSADSCQDRLVLIFVHWEMVGMARTNRRDVLAEGEIQVVHCINRCVRRAYLFGQDPLTGADYEHRRELIRQRMEYLAGIMGIEVLGYSVMSNHFHCVLRSRHDVVATWSDDEVARKWWMLCPARKGKHGCPAEPTEFELNSIRNDKTGLKEKRVRLSSISWFMRFLSERVAKEVNRQDQYSGMLLGRKIQKSGSAG